MRIGHAVGTYQSVAVEVVVARVVVVEVATIIIGPLISLAFHAQTLVNEVPDESALILRIFADELPIFLESTARIAHSVRIFALYEGLLLRFVLRIFLTLSVRPIHRAHDVGILASVGGLPLDGTLTVLLFNPPIGGGKVRSVCRLVAERPVDDRRVVVVHRHVVPVALEDSLRKFRVVGVCFFAEA